MKGNCYSCKFAMEHRKHIRLGEQMRCAKAEELFGTDNIKGGQRWVDIIKSGKTGEPLKAKCGQYEPIEIAPETFKITEPKKVKVVCKHCLGNGKVNVKVMSGTQRVNCRFCEGKGRVDA